VPLGLGMFAGPRRSALPPWHKPNCQAPLKEGEGAGGEGWSCRNGLKRNYNYVSGSPLGGREAGTSSLHAYCWSQSALL